MIIIIIMTLDYTSNLN